MVDRVAVHVGDHPVVGVGARGRSRRAGRAASGRGAASRRSRSGAAATAGARRGGPIAPGMRADQQAPGVRVRAREAGVVAHVRVRVQDVLRVAGPRVGAHVVRHGDDAVALLDRPRRADGAAVPTIATAARAATDAARDGADGAQRGSGEQARRRDELDQVVRPVAAAAEHADGAGPEPRGEGDGEHAVASQRPEAAEREDQHDEQAGERRPGGAGCARGRGAGCSTPPARRARGSGSRRARRRGSPAARAPRPARRRRPRAGSARRPRRPTAQRSRGPAGSREQEDRAGEARVEERLLDQRRGHREQAGADQPAGLPAAVGGHEAADRPDGRDRGEQLGRA